MNKLFQILIVAIIFPLSVGSGFYYLFKPADVVKDTMVTADDNFPKTNKTKVDIVSSEGADCKLPFIKSDDTTLEYANNGKNWQRVLDIMPLKDGAYMEITLDSPGAINFERYFANSSASIATKFCNTNKDNITPVAVSVYFGPQAKPGVILPFDKFYKIGTFTGKKMYFSIPIDQDVYVTTDQDVITPPSKSQNTKMDTSQ
jgi:hypothetical protein